jgi:hypothetical protein
MRNGSAEAASANSSIRIGYGCISLPGRLPETGPVCAADALERQNSP